MRRAWVILWTLRALWASLPFTSTSWREPTAYGSTETFAISTAFPAGTPEEVAGGSHGEVLPGNTVKIVDPLTGAVLPRGQRGEIVGAALTPGPSSRGRGEA